MATIKTSKELWTSLPIHCFYFLNRRHNESAMNREKVANGAEIAIILLQFRGDLWVLCPNLTDASRQLVKERNRDARNLL